MVGRPGFGIHSPSRLQSPLADTNIEQQEGGGKGGTPKRVCVFVSIDESVCVGVYLHSRIGAYLGDS